MKRLKPFLILLIIMLLAYLPLSTFHFAMKNDAFSDNFPQKYFFSAALHAGYFPFWNPYLNFGFPIYSDPGFAFWNPVTWIWGSIIGYNAFTLTAEVLFYIYLAGVSMYYLGRYYKFSFTVSILVASFYMCSGFFVGSLQYINFLTAAAFLPFLLLCFVRLQKTPCFKTAFLCSIAAYLVASSGHPAIPIATLYFLLVIFILIIVHKLNYPVWKTLIGYNFLSFFLLFLFFLPAIYSYLEIFPYYHIPGQVADNNVAAFSFSSFISLIFPFSTAGTFSSFTNDVAMRNIYFSIAGILAVFIALKSRLKAVYILLIAGIIMTLLSLGGSFKENFYSLLPLLKSIRTNGEFRIFIMLCLILVSGIGLNRLMKNDFFSGTWYWLLKATALLALIGLGYAIFLGNSIATLADHPNLSVIGNMKFILSNSSFSFHLLFSSIITLFFSITLLFIKRTKSIWFSLIILGDLIINSIIYLPVTGVGQTTVAQIQHMYHQNPNGFPIPPLKSINQIKNYDDKMKGLLGDKSFYNKEIGITDFTTYPSYFTSTVTYLSSPIKQEIQSHPFVFLLSNMNDRSKKEDLTIVDFSPNKINIKIYCKQPDTLIFLQNYFPFWLAKVNNFNTPIHKKFISFMAIPLAAGNNQIEFQYRDQLLWLLMFISLSSFAVCLVIFFRGKKNSEFNTSKFSTCYFR